MREREREIKKYHHFAHMENAKASMNFTIKELQTYMSMNKIGAYINNILNKFFTILFVLCLNN